MKTVFAKLQWIPPAQGGRHAPPSGSRYSTVARFDQQGDKWREDAWSLVIEWTKSPDASLRHHVHVRFLVEGAPEHLLAAGNRFELLEGARVIATGVIE